MATSRREPPHSDARINKTTRNMSPMLKRTESDQGFRRARSVPSSPDRKPSPSPASSSSNAHRPSSSFNARTASPASSSSHGKTLHSSSSMATRGKADRSGGTSLWPPAAIHSPSSNRGARSPSVPQKSKLPSRPGLEKTTVPPCSSPRLRTQKTQAVSAVRTPGATSKKKSVGAANSAASMQRTKSVPMEAPKIEEREVELLMEFDEMESISTPSIEEHLQERLPDPIELKYADPIASHDAPNKPSSNQHEAEKKEQATEEQLGAKGYQEENADDGINSRSHVLKETVDETEISQVASGTGLKEAVDETASKEEAAIEPELIVNHQETNKAKGEKVMPLKNTTELVRQWRKDEGRSSGVKEESRSKPMGQRRSKIMALIGKFETAMSG